MAAEVQLTRDWDGEAPRLLTLMPADLEGVAEELVAYQAHFAPLFARREQRQWADIYLRGLLLADVPRKNVEAMALRLFGGGPHAARTVRALQQFIGEGAWDDDAILATHQGLVDETLGEADGVLIIDGSDVPKRGRHSVGVARQWCGATGKTDNCQAGVFLGYASRRGYTLLDRRLYLPRDWFTAESRARWQACAIPEDISFRTKAELAAELVEGVRHKQRLRARWLTCDEWYGRNPSFLDRVAATGLDYLAEVPRDTLVWPLVDPLTQAVRPRPEAGLPPRAASGKGRRPTRPRLQPDSPAPVPVEVLARQVPADAWQRYRIVEGSKGPLVADFAALRAVAARDGLPGPEVWVLLRRAVREPGAAPDPKDLKIYLSNATAETPLADLIRVAGLRWPIESCFEEGKGELGLDHYELRFWRGWHHHMTLVILAHHFLVRLQQRLSPREGDPSPASRALRRRAARLGQRARGLPGRSCGRVGAAPRSDDPAQPRRSAPALGRCPSTASTRSPSHPGSARVSASAQARGVLLASPPDSAATR